MVEMPDSSERQFRFYDNREKYLLFVSTCSEKKVIAERIAMDIRGLRPGPPALRVFDAGMGDATVLTRLMRDLHRRYPTVPFLIVGKEISQEDIRLSLEKMADRFYEHPLTVLGGDQHALLGSAVAPSPVERESGAPQLARSAAGGQHGLRVRRADQRPGTDRAGLVEDDSERAHGQSPLRDSLGAGDISPGPGMAARAGHPPERGLAPRIRPGSRSPAIQGEIDGKGQGQERARSAGALPGAGGLHGRHPVNREGPGDGDNPWNLAFRGPVSHTSPGAPERAERAAGRQSSRNSGF